MWTVYFLHTGLTPRMKLYTKETASQWKTYFDTPAPEVCYKVDYTSGFAADSRLDALYINERDYQGETFNGFKKIDSVFIYESGDASGWWYLVTDRGYRNTANGGEHWFALAFDAFMSGTYDINGKLEQGHISVDSDDAWQGREDVDYNRRYILNGTPFNALLVATTMAERYLFDNSPVGAISPLMRDGLVWYLVPFSGTSLTLGNFQALLKTKNATTGGFFYPLRENGITLILPCVFEFVNLRAGATGKSVEMENGETLNYFTLYTETPQGVQDVSMTCKMSTTVKSRLSSNKNEALTANGKTVFLQRETVNIYDYPFPLYRPDDEYYYDDITINMHLSYQGGFTLTGEVRYLSSGATIHTDCFNTKVNMTFNMINDKGQAYLDEQRNTAFTGLFAKIGDTALSGGSFPLALGGQLLHGAVAATQVPKEYGVAVGATVDAAVMYGFLPLVCENWKNGENILEDWNLHGYHHPSRAYRWNGDHTVSTVVPRNFYVFRRFSEVNVTPRALTDSAGLAPVDWCRDVEQMFIDGAYLFKALNETTVSRGRFVYLIEGLSETRVNSNGGG